MAHKLPTWGRRKVNNREFLNKNLKPVRGKVWLPKFKDISELDKRLAEEEYTWYHASETQATLNVSTIRDDISAISERVFGKDRVKKILFPAVYVGRVAKEIAEAGFEVICTDIQGVWVENARKMGMEAHLKSAEEFPEGNIDLAVSFEPAPLSLKPTGYIFSLKVMTETLGFIKIGAGGSDRPSHLIFDKKRNRRLVDVRSHTVFSVLPAYGCLDIHARHGELVYYIRRTTQEAREYAKLDLAVIGMLESRKKISVSKLASALEKPNPDIDNSISRLLRVCSEVYDYDLLEDFSNGLAGDLTLFEKATGIYTENEHESATWKDYVQEIHILD